MPSSYARYIPAHWIKDDLVGDIVEAIDEGWIHFPKPLNPANEGLDPVADFISCLEIELASAESRGRVVETADRVYICSDIMAATVAADMLAFTGIEIVCKVTVDDGVTRDEKTPDCFSWWHRLNGTVVVTGHFNYAFDAADIKQDQYGRYIEKEAALKPIKSEDDTTVYDGGKRSGSIVVKRGPNAYSRHEVSFTDALENQHDRTV